MKTLASFFHNLFVFSHDQVRYRCTDKNNNVEWLLFTQNVPTFVYSESYPIGFMCHMCIELLMAIQLVFDNKIR